jgi:beta-glucosidase
LDGDGLERTDDSEENKILMRKVASEAIVLLRNEGDILPLNPQKLKKIAIIGPNTKGIVFSGGGSAVLKPSYFIKPYDGIVSALEQGGSGTEVTYSEGARGLFHSFLYLSAFRFLICFPSVQIDAFTRRRYFHSVW